MVGEVMPEWFLTIICILFTLIIVAFLVGVCIAAWLMISTAIEDHRSAKASRKFWEEQNK